MSKNKDVKKSVSIIKSIVAPEVVNLLDKGVLVKEKNVLFTDEIKHRVVECLRKQKRIEVYDDAVREDGYDFLVNFQYKDKIIQLNGYVVGEAV
jgi:hypothetical protein